MPHDEGGDSLSNLGKYQRLSSKDIDKEGHDTEADGLNVESNNFRKNSSEMIDEDSAKESRAKYVKHQVLKALYFIQTGAGAGLIKYLPVYFEKLGRTEALIGWLLVTGQITNFVGGLFWGRLADKTGTYKSIMLATNIISIASVWLLSIKGIITDNKYFFPIFILWSFFCSCWGTLVDAVAVIDGGKDYGKLRLWAAVGWGTMALGTGWLISHFNNDYNIIFVTFSVGMFLSSAILFLFFENPLKGKRKERRSSKNSSKSQIDVENSCNSSYVSENNEDGHEPLLEASLISEEEIQVDGQNERDKRKGTSLLNLRKSSVDNQTHNMQTILQNKEVLLFLFSLFLQGVFVAFVESYLYIYLDKVYHTPAFFLGLCTLMATLWEIPVFANANTIIRKIGVVGLLTIAQWLYILRVVAYTYVPFGGIKISITNDDSDNSFNITIPKYYLFLVLEPLHAFVFAAMWSAAVEYSRLIAPSECQGQMQAIVRGVYYFIGNGCGSILGGQLIHYKGYHFMYRFGAVGMTVWSLTWHILMNTCIPAKILTEKMKQIRDTHAKEKKAKK